MRVREVEKVGFYWVKHNFNSRWEPAEFDGDTWHIGEGGGDDLFIVGPRIFEPTEV